MKLARMAVMREKEVIDQSMLEETIKKITPSVNADEMVHYQKFTDVERW